MAEMVVEVMGESDGDDWVGHGGRIGVVICGLGFFLVNKD